MALHILFADLSKLEKPQEYMFEKLKFFFEDVADEQIRQLAYLTYAPGNFAKVPYISPEKMPQFNDKRQTIMDRMAVLFTELVDRKSPLLTNEKLTQKDEISILSEHYEHYPKGTPVFIRRTNLATLAFFYNGAIVDNEHGFRYEDVAVLNQESDIKNIPIYPKANNNSWKPLYELAKSITGITPIGVLKKLGMLAVNSLFPTKESLSYEKILEDFRNILISENINYTVSLQVARLQTVLDVNTFEYLPKKDKNYPKEELHKQALEFRTTLIDVRSILSTTYNNYDYTITGFPIYLHANTYLLANYQELAMVDPIKSNPLDSAYIKSIIEVSKESHNYATNTIKKIKDKSTQERLSKISGVLYHQWCDTTGSGTICKNRYYFTDSQTGYRSSYYEQNGSNDDPKKRCTDARNNYAKNIETQHRKELDAEMQDIVNTVEEWKKLQTNPLPQ